MANLFPVFDMPDLYSGKNDARDERYQTSIYWDSEKGDFSLDGAHRMVACSGQDAYMQWCQKQVYTERYVCLAYPSEIGVEMVDALSQEEDEAVESCIERTLSEALLVNPRTDYVRGFQFEWDGDAVTCSFTVKGKGYAEGTLRMTYQRNNE